MPVLHPGGNHDNAALVKAHGRLALFLIPALSGGAYEQLSAAARRVMNVPVIAAAGLEGNVRGEKPALRVGQGIQKRVPDEEPGLSSVRGTGSENIRLFKRFFVFVFHFHNPFLIEISDFISYPDSPAVKRLDAVELQFRHRAVLRKTVEHGAHSAASVDTGADQHADLIEKPRGEESGVYVPAADDRHPSDAETLRENHNGAAKVDSVLSAGNP